MSYFEQDLCYDLGYDTDRSSSTHSSNPQQVAYPEVSSSKYLMDQCVQGTPHREIAICDENGRFTGYDEDADIDIRPGERQTARRLNPGRNPLTNRAPASSGGGDDQAARSGDFSDDVPPPPGSTDEMAPPRQPAEPTGNPQQAGQEEGAGNTDNEEEQNQNGGNRSNRQRRARPRPAPRPQAPGFRRSGDSFSFQAGNILERHGLTTEAQQDAYLAAQPRGTQSEAEYLGELRGLDAGEVRTRMARGTVRQMLDYYRQHGVDPDVAYENLRARGLISEDAEAPNRFPRRIRDEDLPPLAENINPDDVVWAQTDLENMREGGIGNRGQANDRVRGNTTRHSMARTWIEEVASQPDYDRSRATRILENTEPAIMRNGTVTDFDIDEGSGILFRSPEDGEGLFDENGLVRQQAVVIAPGSQVEGSGPVAVTQADLSLNRRRDLLNEIRGTEDNPGLLGADYLDIPLEDRNAILGAQTDLGGPLVDQDGNLLPDVSEEQLENYRNALQERSAELGEAREEMQDFDRQLQNEELSDSERSRLERRREAAEERYLNERREFKQELYSQTASFYRGNLPGLMRRSGLTADQTVQVMNGRGYLGRNPEISEMADDYHRLRNAGSDSERNALRDEMRAEIDDHGYVVPQGEGVEAQRGRAIRADLQEEQQNGRQGQQGSRANRTNELESQQRQFDFQERMQEDSQSHEREMETTRNSHQERRDATQREHEREMKVLDDEMQQRRDERGHEMRMEEQRQQGALQMAGNIIGSLLQGLMPSAGQMIGVMAQGLVQSTPRAPDPMAAFNMVRGTPSAPGQ